MDLDVVFLHDYCSGCSDWTELERKVGRAEIDSRHDRRQVPSDSATEVTNRGGVDARDDLPRIKSNDIAGVCHFVMPIIYRIGCGIKAVSVASCRAKSDFSRTDSTPLVR